MVDQVCLDMILNDLSHKTGYGPSHPGDAVEDLGAASLGLERFLDRVDLTADAPYAGNQVAFAFNRM